MRIASTKARDISSLGPEETAIKATLNRWTLGATAIAFLISALALIGYATGVSAFYSIQSSAPAMSPLTAFGLLSLSVAQFARTADSRKAALILGTAVMVLGAAAFIDQLLRNNDLLSPWIAHHLFGAAPTPGRGSLGTAISLILLGITYLPWFAARPRHSDVAAAGAFLLSILALLGQAYGAEDIGELRIFRTMAPNTAVSVLALAIAAILSQREGGWVGAIMLEGPAGRTTRRQLLFGLLPPLVGYCLVEAATSGLLQLGAAMALLVVMTITPLLWLALRSGQTLADLEEERAKRQNAEARHLGMLEQRVDVAMAERELAQEALRQSQKMEAMGQLTGGVAHDFNNLLTPVIGSLDLIARRTDLTGRERRLIEGALQSADRARTLIQRLLAFARRQPLKPGPVDIAAVVRGMHALLASSVGAQVRLEVNLPDGLPPARAEANQVEMAILNLCVNARDAMSDGGSLTIAVAERTEEENRQAALPPGHYVVISVTDTGMGMDAETQRRAVEPFFSTKGIGKGTGLGLSMVHGLAAQLHGGLDIQSQPGLGTRVDLWLPVANEPLAASPEPVQTAPAAVRVGRALLVDDEPALRLAIADMLQELGYSVTEASSAVEARSLIEGGTEMDVMITDHVMPGMSGAQLARLVKQSRPGLPILLVSGYADVDDVAPDLPRLNKPFKQTELAQALAQIMRDDEASSG
ncbi:ATP-binding protein [Sphingomonas sp. UNC305MFCol5.2]|uniref:ATP-binding protein n=1 Tax=Sphingomonas sp. UNC305MFCol5.2 TaxID=1449076 RepID=UPI000B2CA975|nr:ATP-binding protein [Sphingomonas sp. UNC305MFCol5.2]